jgi:exodeoxyribonuclease-5
MTFITLPTEFTPENEIYDKIVLNDEQQHVLDYIMKHVNEVFSKREFNPDDKFVIKVSGYAGTGKTTLLVKLRTEIEKTYRNKSIAFLAYTGKASSVLKTKLDENYINLARDYVGTIHSFLYKPITKWDRLLKSYVVTGWKLKEYFELDYDMIVIDEGSMISKKIWDDLQISRIPIVVFGDNNQLPPVGDQFNLLEKVDFQLKQIHRQALDSPIIQLSQFVREYGYIPNNRFFSKSVFKLSWDMPECKSLFEKVEFDENVIVLCAFNMTRNALNKKIRKKLGYEKKRPSPGERIICLQNYHNIGIMNGQIGTMIWDMPEEYNVMRATVQLDSNQDLIECTISDKCFDKVSYPLYEEEAKRKSYGLTSQERKRNQYFHEKGLYPICYFDYGYAISVHKSQGSEWDKVVLFEQRTKLWDDEYYAKWLYTAVTRAKERLFIISDYYG